MKLNPQQQAAVNHKDGPVLILAGAGSGKTRVIVNRIARLILEENIPAWKILAVTFTNKAANEMRERVESFEGIEKPCGVTMGTFHSVCVRILRREHERLGFNRSFSICDDSQQVARIKLALQELGVDNEKFKPKSILASISKAKNNFVTPEKMLQDAGFNPFRKIAAQAYEIYEKGLKADHAMDFDDLITKTVTLMKNEPEILERYQNRYRYILIDEYQDTNFAQNSLITLIADKYRNIMAVGDDDQSIYRWRGAEVSNILEFPKVFPGAKVIKLEQNYRSTQVILSAAAGLMEHNRIRHKKQLWSDRKGGEKVQYHQYLTDRTEAEAIAETIRELVQDGGREFSDFAVFYRMNAQSRVIEEVFQTRRVPHQIVGNISFFKRKEVKDLLSYIRLVLNPFDSGSCRRIINVPRRGIGKTTLQFLEDLATKRGVDLFTAIDTVINENLLKAHKYKHVKVFLDLINDLIRFERTHSAKEFVDHLLQTTGYKEMYLMDNSPEARASLEIIQEFVNTVAEFTQRTSGNLAEFADYLSLHSEEEDTGETQEKVQVMTLHNAKGLEFPVVFLTGLEEKICPLTRMDETLSEDDIAEERRLVYVGMTRAEDQLFLSGAERRFLYGRQMNQFQSRFISEIPSEFLEAGEVVKEPQLPHNPQSFNESDKRMGIKAPSVSRKADYVSGERIRHPKWGVGVVMSCSGSGIKAKLVIRFDRFGRKKIMAGMANIVKLN